MIILYSHALASKKVFTNKTCILLINERIMSTEQLIWYNMQHNNIMYIAWYSIN